MLNKETDQNYNKWSAYQKKKDFKTVKNDMFAFVEIDCCLLPLCFISTDGC